LQDGDWLIPAENGGFMAVSKEDRNDYKRGQHDRDLGLFDQVITDITVQHPDSDAYYKGRRGEQLNEDKDD
jgi:hypothetical protein